MASESPPPTTSDSVADRLRAKIMTERLGPGVRLGREEDLARELAVSRATLREGLRVLFSEHLNYLRDLVAAAHRYGAAPESEPDAA